MNNDRECFLPNSAFTELLELEAKLTRCMETLKEMYSVLEELETEIIAKNESVCQ